MDTVYEVYETDADDTMDLSKLVHCGKSLDIAETRMVLLYQAAGFQKDFLLYDFARKNIVGNAMSPDTMVKKGICPQ